MATVTFGKIGTRPYGVLTVTETSTSTANNTSALSISLVLKRPYSISSSATKTASCTINGTTYSWSGTIGGVGDKTLISKTQTVTHNSDGKKTINISASIVLNINWGGTQLGTISGSDTMKLTDIPRYATVTQSNPSKTETAITMKWTSNATVDYIWYSKNNGSTWTGINVADGTSGTYTIDGLTANTAYQIKTRVRRKDSQLTTDSSALSVTTYAYPYANSMPNFNVGDRLTIGIFNPLKRTVTVNIIGADNSQISNDTTTGASITGYNGTTVVNRLLASTPNAKTATYKVKVTYGSIETTKTGGTYTVGEAYAPSIGALSYEDIRASVTAITGNNQLIVRNQSTVEFTARDLTALQGASVTACKVTVNGVDFALTLSGSMAYGGYGTIDSASDLAVTFTATDSRGISATKELTVTMLDWILPTAIITAQRQSNYYSDTDVNVSADYSSVDGKNTITIQCRHKKTSDSTYSAYITLQDNVTSVITLDNLYEWDVQVKLTDRFGGTTTYNLIIPLGMPIIYFDRLKNSVGINCFPQDNKSLELNGVSLVKSMATAYLSAAITYLAVNTYTKVPLDAVISTGSKLSLTNDGGIQIGAGVSYVKISAILSYNQVQTDASRHIRIVKNSYTNDNTLAWAYNFMLTGDPQTIVIPPMLAPVTQGDIIYLLYYANSSTDAIGGNAYGNRTSLTVETI